MKYQCDISTGYFQEIPQIIIEGDMTSDADADVKKVYSQIKGQKPIASLILNFEHTKYINSSGIATLINIVQDLNETGGKAYFVGMSDHFKKVMEIVGISDFVTICSTNDEAYQLITR